MYPGAPKTSFEITAEANRQEWDEFLLQLRKNFNNGRSFPKE